MPARSLNTPLLKSSGRQVTGDENDSDDEDTAPRRSSPEGISTGVSLVFNAGTSGELLAANSCTENGDCAGCRDFGATNSNSGANPVRVLSTGATTAEGHCETTGARAGVWGAVTRACVSVASEIGAGPGDLGKEIRSSGAQRGAFSGAWSGAQKSFPGHQAEGVAARTVADANLGPRDFWGTWSTKCHWGS